MKTESVFGINFAKITLNDLIVCFEKYIKEGLHAHVHTVNVDHLVIASKDPSFRTIMKNAEIVVADGMPIVWYSRLVKRPLPERVTGVDTCELICKESSQMNFKIYMLGAEKGIALKAKKNMESKFPGVKIVGVYSPDPEEIESDEGSINIIKKINDSNANILLVAFGAPKQELWISKYKSRLQTNVNIGVGATLDFMAGRVRRAPIFIQKIGLEWLFRLLNDPKRLIKRYLVNDFRFIKIAIMDFRRQVHKI